MNLSAKKLSFLLTLVIILFTFCLFQLNYERETNKNLKRTIIELTKRVDSLENEIFVYELKLFRFERAVEIYEERNPESTSEFNDIIADETE